MIRWIVLPRRLSKLSRRGFLHSRNGESDSLRLSQTIRTDDFSDLSADGRMKPRKKNREMIREGNRKENLEIFRNGNRKENRKRIPADTKPGETDGRA